MRKVLLVVIVALVACMQAARADANPNAAPADEYFGPYQQSVLEIRNRLNDFDQRDVGSMLDPSVPTYLDHLQLAIRDWQQKYPGDPWLAPSLAHLVREYWRAGQASSTRGMSALADLRTTYPDAAITQRTVALVYGSNPDLGAVANNSSEVASVLPPYAVEGPEQAPPPEEAPPQEAPPPAEQPSPFQAEPPDEAPPPEEPPSVEQAPPAEYGPPPAEEAQPAEQAPVVEEQSPAGAPAPGYDAARGYDPVHGYDASRGYDAARGYNVAPSYDAARGYDATRGYDVSRGYDATASGGRNPYAAAPLDASSPQ